MMPAESSSPLGRGGSRAAHGMLARFDGLPPPTPVDPDNLGSARGTGLESRMSWSFRTGSDPPRSTAHRTSRPRLHDPRELRFYGPSRFPRRALSASEGLPSRGGLRVPPRHHRHS